MPKQNGVFFSLEKGLCEFLFWIDRSSAEKNVKRSSLKLRFNSSYKLPDYCRLSTEVNAIKAVVDILVPCAALFGQMSFHSDIITLTLVLSILNEKNRYRN